MGKSKLGKHVGYFDQLIAKLNKHLLEDAKLDPFTRINKGLLEEIASTWKRIKEDTKHSEIFIIPSSTQILDSSFPGEKGTPKQVAEHYKDHPYVELPLKEE
jgi:hypothetical protein